MKSYKKNTQDRFGSTAHETDPRPQRRMRTHTEVGMRQLRSLGYSAELDTGGLDDPVRLSGDEAAAAASAREPEWVSFAHEAASPPPGGAATAAPLILPGHMDHELPAQREGTGPAADAGGWTQGDFDGGFGDDDWSIAAASFVASASQPPAAGPVEHTRIFMFFVAFFARDRRRAGTRVCRATYRGAHRTNPSESDALAHTVHLPTHAVRAQQRRLSDAERTPERILRYGRMLAADRAADDVHGRPAMQREGRAKVQGAGMDTHPYWSKRGSRAQGRAKWPTLRCCCRRC